MTNALRRSTSFTIRGIISFVEHLNKNKTPLHDKVIISRVCATASILKLRFSTTTGYQEQIFAFANNINTHEGGTHLIGFQSALTRTVNNYAVANNLFKEVKENLSGDDVREGLVCVISVKLPNPQFEGQNEGPSWQQRSEGYCRNARQ